MHLSDGILTESLNGQLTLAVTTVGAAGMLAYSLKKIKPRDASVTALMTAVFFVSSLIHFKVGFSSLHLVLAGLMGVLMGWHSVAALFVGLALQAIFFGHGGITVLGVNLFNFSCGALLASLLYRLRPAGGAVIELAAGFAAGFSAVAVAAMLLALELFAIGDSWRDIAEFTLLWNLPLAVIEGLIVAFALQFIRRVRPEMLNRLPDHSAR